MYVSFYANVFPDYPAVPGATPPITPARERIRGKMRRLRCLSEGVRSLNAKMRLLRDETDRMFGESDETQDSSDRLVDQYDSIGGDLRDLMKEWEQGKVALNAASHRHSRSRSLSKHRLSVPLSPTSSLGGTTATEGSPHDALRALNGTRRSSSRSSATSDISDEQILEAVAAPIPRNVMSREKRILQNKEDQIKQAQDKEKAQAATHLLRELESVIKLRPKKGHTGRVTSI